MHIPAGSRVGPLTALSRIFPKLRGNRRKDVSGGEVRFGPFAPGDIVRIGANCNGWWAAGNQDVTTDSGSDGAPIAAWDRQEYEVRDEGEKWVAFYPDGGGASGEYALAYRVGRLACGDESR